MMHPTRIQLPSSPSISPSNMGILSSIVGQVPKRPYSPQDLYTAAVLLYKTFPLLLPVISFVNAPHGRFSIPSAFNVNGNLGWLIMEVVSPLTFLYTLSSGALSPVSFSSTYSSFLKPSMAHLSSLPTANKLLAALFVIHYANRAVIQPLRSPPRSPMHISVPISAIFFNLVNGFIMGAWLGGCTPSLDSGFSSAKSLLQSKAASSSSWSSIFSRSKSIVSTTPILTGAGLIPDSEAFRSPLFYLGIIGWAIGFASNVYHDEILMNLRRPGANREGPAKGTRSQTNGNAHAQEDGKPKYEVPYGGLYQFISYPNYFSEWIEWFSFALSALVVIPAIRSNPLLALSAPPLLFPIIEVALMLPRAVNGHAWYRSRFGVVGDGKGGRYPAERKAVIPFVL